MPHRTLVNQLTGKQTEARQVTLPMLEYGLVAQNVDHLLRFTNDSNLIVDRCHSGREDRKLKLRHRRIVSLPLLSAACSDISCRTGQFIFLAAPLLCPLTSGCLNMGISGRKSPVCFAGLTQSEELQLLALTEPIMSPTFSASKERPGGRNRPFVCANRLRSVAAIATSNK